MANQQRGRWGPVASLLIVAFCFVVGIVASLMADSRDPEAEAKRAERAPHADKPEPEAAVQERSGH